MLLTDSMMTHCPKEVSQVVATTVSKHFYCFSTHYVSKGHFSPLLLELVSLLSNLILLKSSTWDSHDSVLRFSWVPREELLQHFANMVSIFIIRLNGIDLFVCLVFLSYGYHCYYDFLIVMLTSGLCVSQLACILWAWAFNTLHSSWSMAWCNSWNLLSSDECYIFWLPHAEGLAGHFNSPIWWPLGSVWELSPPWQDFGRLFFVTSSLGKIWVSCRTQ